MMYVEFPSDAAFTLFLAQLTPSKVLRDREANFSKPERKIAAYVREPRVRGRQPMFSRRQIEIAIQSVGRK